MINQAPLALFEEFAGGRLIKPIYQDYSFGNLPATIYYLFTGQKTGALLPPDCFGGSYPKPKRVVLFLIDTFGFSLWQKHYQQFSWLEKLTDKGIVTPISALFPSTTAASVSTIHFGVLPSRHAMFEWNLYIPKFGEVIQSLPFTPLGEESQDGCLDLGYDPYELYAVKETFFHRLAKAGVRSLKFGSSSFAFSVGNRIAGQGAEIVPIRTLAEGLVNLTEVIRKAKKQTFFYFYWGDIDGIAHRYGPDSTQLKAEIASLWLTFSAVFDRLPKDQETLFLFTADHGQIGGDPKKAYYLNDKIPEIRNWLKLSPQGKIIYPIGSGRDVFLHLKPQKVAEACQALKEKLQNRAEVILIKDAIKEGLFGPRPFSAEFRKRLGNLLILPYGGEYVWWYEKDKLEAKHYGSHGGLTKEEMITVLAAFRNAA